MAARLVSVLLMLVLFMGDACVVFSDEPESYPKAALKTSVNGIWMRDGSKLFSLKKASKNTTDGFGVLQGGCSDGENYAYFAYTRKSDDATKIVKMRIVPGSTPEKTKYKYVSSTAVLTGVTHGNDLTYVKNAGGSGRDKIYVINSVRNSNPSYYISTIDVSTMREEGGKSYRYWRDLSECDPDPYPADSDVRASKRKTLETLVGEHRGYSNIAYDADRDMFAALLKGSRDLIILRPVWVNGELSDLKLLKYARQNKINATSQGMDVDSSYIYTGWSPESGRLNKNILQIYDWEGNHVGDRTLSSNYEFENIIHTGKGSEARFYANFYRSYYEYYKVTKTKKVKWKKVKKRVRVRRTKKVKKKVRGKTKWVKKRVWRWKTKKVWKYKKKRYKVTKKRFVRDSYGMYLGNMTN